MTIRTRIIASVLVLFAMIAGMFAATWIISSAQKTDGLVINLAGRQRMLGQKLAKEAMHLMHLGAESSERAATQRDMETTMQLFETTQQALLSSGKAPLTLNPNGPSVSLPAAEGAIRSQLEAVRSLWSSYRNTVTESSDAATAQTATRIAEASMNMQDAINKAVDMMQLEAEGKVTLLLLVQGICLALGSVILTLVIFNIRRDIIAPLEALRTFARAVAAGKLDVPLEGRFKMELAALKDDIQTMVAELKTAMAAARAKGEEAERNAGETAKALAEAHEQKEAVNQLLAATRATAEKAKAISGKVNASVEELTTKVDEVNRGVDIQRARMDEVATAMEEMNSTVLEVAGNASNAATSAEHSRENARTGVAGVRKAVAAMQQIEGRMDGLKSTMHDLGQRADNIGRIIDVINDIADQTNLLALNAAIEAARAGEAGRGFAVVADEVRKLAEKTMTATKEVSQAIGAIQGGARDNIHAVEATASYINESTLAANEAGQFMEEIEGIVDETALQVSSIATASEEQSAASEEINQAVTEVSRVAIDTAADMELAARALMEISSLVNELDTLVQGVASGSGTGHSAGGKLVSWSSALSIGIDSIDDQHKMLLDLINELHAAMKNRSGISAMGDITRRLREYTVKHFGNEEKLFARHGYPETPRHKETHARFVAKVEDFERGLANGSAAVTMDIMNFLKDWLIKHIQGEDKRYAPFLIQRGVR